MRFDLVLWSSPAKFRDYGLVHAGVQSNPKHGDRRRETDFRKHYGGSSLALADQWMDLQFTSGTLTEDEKSLKGLDRFFIAHHVIWAYPKNAKITADKFNICEDYAKGDHLWDWIEKIGALRHRKIIWCPRKLNDPNAPTFIAAVNGTDFRVWEKRHPTLPKDPGQMSHKFKHGALKYLIAVANYESQICFVSGPHRGAKGDLTIFREDLFPKVAKGKLLNADRGFRSKRQAEKDVLSLPNPSDSAELSRFKSRSRLRLETFNGRLKQYQILDQTFRGGIEKHEHAFFAVLVTWQYRMDNGEPLYDV